jgi:hypothetical protein
MKLGDLAASLGKGLVAGAIGTAAMTVSSTVEMKLRRRKPSDAPARAAAKLLGVEPLGEAEKQRFANLVHWAYGTDWGLVRGLLGVLGLSGPGATAAHFGAVWGTELVMLPALGVTSPPTEWGATEVAIDAWHHIVYAVATSFAYELLDRQPGARGRPPKWPGARGRPPKWRPR